jgi:hypothetical protein
MPEKMRPAVLATPRAATDAIGEIDVAGLTTPAINGQAGTLLDLAAQIEAEHQAAVGASRTALEHAVRCGELLIRAKSEIGHGDWIEWLEVNCSVRPRTAQVYMRLARELPKLSEENAQRVAHLTVRDAVVAVSQTTASIAALPKPDQEQFLELAETSGDHLRSVRHRHQRAKQRDALELAKAAPTPVYASPERRKRLLRNAKEHRLMLVIGPNSAGLHLENDLRALKEDDEYLARHGKIDELRRDADELGRRAADLRREADQRGRDLDAWTAAALTERHGSIRPFIETATYDLDAEMFDKLSQLPEQEAIEGLLDLGFVPQNRGYWGDIRYLQHFGMPQPAAEWTSVGNEHGLPQEIVASVLPVDGEAAP